MRRLEREFQVFAKPVGSLCNLDCTYCYYLERSARSPRRGKEVMPAVLLERYIRQHLEAATGTDVLFSWHGGEPILAGIGFYRLAVGLQERYKRTGVTVINGIQTNGTLLDQKWCEFLRQASFIVGVSVDGPAHLHDHFRLSKDGRPTHSRVMHGYAMLLRYGIPVEVLCVVNAVNVDYPLELYRYFRETGARYLTFLPLVERVKGSCGRGEPAYGPGREIRRVPLPGV